MTSAPTTRGGLPSSRSGKGREQLDPDAYLKAAEGYVEAMFPQGSGRRCQAPLRRLLTLGLGIAPDVKACPCQTIVPLLPTSRLRGDKTGDQCPHRYGLRVRGAQGDRASRRYRRLREEEPHHHRIPLASETELDSDITLAEGRVRQGSKA